MRNNRAFVTAAAAVGAVVCATSGPAAGQGMYCDAYTSGFTPTSCECFMLGYRDRLDESYRTSFRDYGPPRWERWNGWSCRVASCNNTTATRYAVRNGGTAGARLEYLMATHTEFYGGTPTDWSCPTAENCTTYGGEFGRLEAVKDPSRGTPEWAQLRYQYDNQDLLGDICKGVGLAGAFDAGGAGYEPPPAVTPSVDGDPDDPEADLVTATDPGGSGGAPSVPPLESPQRQPSPTTQPGPEPLQEWSENAALLETPEEQPDELPEVEAWVAALLESAPEEGAEPVTVGPDSAMLPPVVSEPGTTPAEAVSLPSDAPIEEQMTDEEMFEVKLDELLELSDEEAAAIPVDWWDAITPEQWEAFTKEQEYRADTQAQVRAEQEGPETKTAYVPPTLTPGWQTNRPEDQVKALESGQFAWKQDILYLDTCFGPGWTTRTVVGRALTEAYASNTLSDTRVAGRMRVLNPDLLEWGHLPKFCQDALIATEVARCPSPPCP